ncbi:malonyl-CoA decarboxylase, mitochondrial isoform X2 [Patella vulgata]|uniref:malonyl-CoA decarboxylase, mitochondrial isoform X2 n=1 Tax=Patella vulgata TaxID=6465 RepID=UPI00218062B1|nr:malonyl-CoA decarboxylase, mitochondrial isoform X2 [Patella vulgata]
MQMVFSNVKFSACKNGIMPIRTMTSDIPSFLESTFSCPDMNILSTERKCKEFLSYYGQLTPEDKGMFLTLLSEKYGVNQDNVTRVAQSVAMSQERGEAVLLSTQERLRNTLLPRYQQLFRQIGRIDGGVKFLVDLRADVISRQLNSTSEIAVAYYRALNTSLRELLSLWFAVGFLNLQRVTWMSPCDMVQKISEYEAVHPIRNWTDLKRRVGPYRRCFVFTHNSMPHEPVVVLHTALTQEISSSIHSIIHSPGFWPGGVKKEPTDSTLSPPTNDVSSPNMEKEDPNQISAAVFYSITSTLKGLQGVELGNYLIKKVVHEVQQEFDHIKQFSSLSPIPGFKEWLITDLNQSIHAKVIGEDFGKEFITDSEQSFLQPYMNSSHSCVLELLKDFVQSNTWVSREDLERILKPILMRLCARYLYQEKRRQYALNPVANFHLRNGAVIWRVNWMADMSMRGLNASCGMMVNYRYYLSSTEENSCRYLEEYHIEASQDVLDMCAGIVPGTVQ